MEFPMYVSLFARPGYDTKMLKQFGFDGEYNFFYGHKGMQNLDWGDSSWDSDHHNSQLEENHTTMMEWGNDIFPIGGRIRKDHNHTGFYLQKFGTKADSRYWMCWTS